MKIQTTKFPGVYFIENDFYEDDRGDFSISYNEARETLYCLKLLNATNYMCTEIAKI